MAKEKTWVVPVEQDPHSDELLITFPDDLLKKVDWKEGDVIEWHDNGDGTWTLKRKL